MLTKKLLSFSIISLLILGIFVLSANFVLAADPTSILPEPTGEKPTDCASGNCGNYTLNDFMLIGINVSQWILGISGSLALAMFIYGGFLMLISGGNKTSIEKGRKTLTTAVIGLLIIFSSYIIIKFVSVNLLNANWTDSGKITVPTQ